MAVLYNEELRMLSSEQRYIWASYLLFVALSSLIGDTVILLASRNGDNFRLNKFLVTIMQYIAVCDIAVSITTILPSAASLIADAWILGDALCFVAIYLNYYYMSANTYLICVLSTGKILLLRNPAQARNWSKKRGHVICSVVWIFSLVFPIFKLTLGDDVSFDYKTYTCHCGFSSSMLKRIMPFFTTASIIITNAVMMSTTIPTLKYLVKARNTAIQAKKSVPWQGALTVSFTAIVYCITTLPLGVYFFCRSIVGQENNVLNLLYRYGAFSMYANISSNFFIYAFTITSFRKYLLKSIMEISGSITTASCCKQQTGDSKRNM